MPRRDLQTVEEKTKPIRDEELRTEIRTDISHLKTMHSPKLFNYAYSLFVNKWRSQNILEIDVFDVNGSRVRTLNGTKKRTVDCHQLITCHKQCD